MSKNVQNFSKNQLAAIRWFAADKHFRVPETQGALAKELGIHERTISRWKKIPAFWDAVNDLAREKFRQDIAQFYAAATREAKKGSYQHLRMAFEMTGELIDRKQIDVNVRNLSDDELLAIIED